MLDDISKPPTVRTAVSTSELRRRGLPKRGIQSALDAGSLLRLRPGWYAFPDTPPAIATAVRLGGAAGCISGAALHGLWHPENHALHVCFTHQGHRRDTATEPSGGLVIEMVVAHWGAKVNLTTSKGLLPIAACIAEVVRCQPPDVAFAVIESALRRRRITEDQRNWIGRQVAKHLRWIVTSAGHLADSGSESLFRFRMMQLGVSIRSQVAIPGVGTVDFVIGDRLVVEIDSTEHHSGNAQRLRDLRRDATLVGLGFLPLRLDYLQILYDWETVAATVLSVIARGEHLHHR